MSNKIKTLNESRRKLIADAQVLDLGTAENRATVTKIHADVEAIDSQIILEARSLELAGQRAPKLSDDETRSINQFDTAKLLRHLHANARGANVGVLDGIEAEMIQEGEREARAAGINTSGIVLPRILVRRQHENRDMTAQGGTAGDQGGNTIQTNKAGLLDDFFNQSVIRQAGATVLEGLTGNLDIPRLIAGTTPAKKTENAAADEVSPTTAMLSLTPKRLPAYIDISEMLMKQSSSAIDAILRKHLTAQMLAVSEAAFFHGGGTSEANGIAGTSGIGSVAGGTNGLAPTNAHIIALETAVDTTNALLGNLRYVSNGQIRGKLKQTLRNPSGTDASFILGDSGLVNGYSPLFTNAVSRTLTKGSSSLASAIFFGNFSDYYVGYWGGVSLELVRDKTNAISGLYTLVASTYYDGGVVRPKSFAAMLDALGA